MKRPHQYIDVIWSHDSLEYPVRLVSELSADRCELRKLEFFRDGTVDAADIDRETSRTRLGIGGIPSLDEINQDPQFLATAIHQDHFDRLWLQYAFQSEKITDLQCLQIAEQYLSSHGIGHLCPGTLGRQEPDRCEVIFLIPETMDPEIAVVDPPDVRVWVSLSSGLVKLIDQM
ncbi:DUF6881 domain-containing protein [Comamonas sp. MYb69]|uniref:DUF6881 domain-containing protein n=1 Tax=Comamonas sp. MYb69 TaxID=1848650 RepID=UPI0030ACC2BF